jgi:hypothetical protein
MHRLTVSVFLLSCLFLFPLSFVGCGGDPVAEGFKKSNRLNMQKIANAYRMFASINNNMGPENEEEFKEFLRSDDRIAYRLGLTSLDLDNLDGYFTSEADEEPFVVLYGQKIDPALDYSALVFDKTGVDGMRRIALACSEIIEVTDKKKYERILAGNIQVKDVPAHVFGGPIDESAEEQGDE